MIVFVQVGEIKIPKGVTTTGGFSPNDKYISIDEIKRESNVKKHKIQFSLRTFCKSVRTIWREMKAGVYDK